MQLALSKTVPPAETVDWLGLSVQPLGADPPPVFELQSNACAELSQVQLLPLMVMVAARAGAAAKLSARAAPASMALLA